MRNTVLKEGESRWEFFLLYVDNILCISQNEVHIVRNEIGKYFQINNEAGMGAPDIHFGNKVSEINRENGIHTWAFSPSQYARAAVHNVEEYLK